MKNNLSKRFQLPFAESASKLTYLEWLQLKKYSQRSLETLKSLYRHQLHYFRANYLELNRENLSAYAYWTVDQGYSRVYEHQLQWGLKSFYRYLQLVRDWKGPLSLPQLKKIDGRRKALDAAEFAILENWLQQEADALKSFLWTLFYGCGLRRIEVIRLRLEDFRARDKMLIVSGVKWSRHRQIPLSTHQVTRIKGYLYKLRPKAKRAYQNRLLLGPRGGACSSFLGEELRRWQEGSDLGHRFCWHVLRHTIATHLVKSGLSLFLLSEFLGHKSLASTAHYLHTGEH